ncbi:hypothetical protein PCH_Pc13g03750 [Penicillium rubens Wisconsin 54-1255]|uniref:Uncharacterized protein n=1 Tax=Penicillium rubens (strain ATCC 28089 / DSM 1075 / NRRL 1951 / Wisconsin 54-1255) TaxID=500485 RepID=B6H222_PENRW|nr:hypothetical protein PCH_Pc13g03750 [Penicillium rubens Wisconsin 54-1255]
MSAKLNPGEMCLFGVWAFEPRRFAYGSANPYLSWRVCAWPGRIKNWPGVAQVALVSRLSEQRYIRGVKASSISATYLQNIFWHTPSAEEVDIPVGMPSINSKFLNPFATFATSFCTGECPNAHCSETKSDGGDKRQG